jgi:hypothetical protein
MVAFDIDRPFLPGSETAYRAGPVMDVAELLAMGQPMPLRGMKNYDHSLDGPIRGWKDCERCSDDGVLAVNLDCGAFLPRDLEENPICAGYVWQRSSDLVLFASFPSDRGQLGQDGRWRAPVMAAISLVTSWRLDE